jgi:hypothetical protein
MNCGALCAIFLKHLLKFPGIDKQEIFFSYSKAASEEFVLLLAKVVHKAGANRFM